MKDIAGQEVFVGDMVSAFNKRGLVVQFETRKGGVVAVIDIGGMYIDMWESMSGRELKIIAESPHRDVPKKRETPAKASASINQILAGYAELEKYSIAMTQYEQALVKRDLAERTAALSPSEKAKLQAMLAERTA